MRRDGLRVGLVGPLPPELGGRTAGGVATHQAALAKGLIEQGVDAHLLATNTFAARPAGARADSPCPMLRMCPLRPTDADYVRAVGAGTLARYTLHLARERGDGSRRERLGQLLWYRHFLCTVRPALVHVQHPLERHTLIRYVLCAERLRLPVVVTAHGLFGEHPERSIHDVMAPNLRAADRVIAVSPHVAEQAIQLGVEPTRVRVIRSGVDLERFRPRDRGTARRRLGLAENLSIVLFVGNLEPRKHLDVLIRSLPSVRAGVPEAIVVVVGSGASAGANDQSTSLQALTAELDLPSAVRFVGNVDADDLLDWYAAADVFALPSSSEAQGIAALEAMASGLPVVASAVGGLAGTIHDGRTGVLVEPGDAAALSDALRRLLSDAAMRTSVGAAARQAVTRDFAWSPSVSATIEVYQEALLG